MEIKHRNELHKLLPPESTVVELGCAESLFSLDILKWPNTKLLYMVDAWQTLSVPGDGSSPQEWHDKNYSEAMNRVRGFPVKVLRGMTTEMAEHVSRESVDLVYVDACHSYDCVAADIRAWWPKLKHRGVMAFHDYLNRSYGVSDAVNEFAGRYGFKVFPIPENKPEDAGAWIRKP